MWPGRLDLGSGEVQSGLDSELLGAFSLAMGMISARGSPVYDDSIALSQEWEEIADGPPEWLGDVWRERPGFAGEEMRAAREAALARLESAQSAST